MTIPDYCVRVAPRAPLGFVEDDVAMGSRRYAAAMPAMPAPTTATLTSAAIRRGVHDLPHGVIIPRPAEPNRRTSGDEGVSMPHGRTIEGEL